jgi:hypothetical protein
MIILCDGMVRSGSTWSFNVCLKLLQTADPGRKVFGFFNSDPAVLVSAARPRFSNLVIKSHALDPSGQELCRNGKIKAVYTWRNPYDVIVSCVRMFGRSVEHWLGSLRSALRLWSFHRATNSAHIVPYETIMARPSEAVLGVAQGLGIEVAQDGLDRIVRETSFEQNKRFSRHFEEIDPRRIVRNNGYVFDRQTLLHRNHVVNGGIGYGVGALSKVDRCAVDAVLWEEGFGELQVLGGGSESTAIAALAFATASQNAGAGVLR